MPKPTPASIPSNYSQQQPRPAPFVASPPPPPVKPKPSGNSLKQKRNLHYRNRLLIFFFLAANRPSFNNNAQAATRSGNRVFTKGNKGSASLNQNENINQTATCYTCGITIRYINT